jgi:hypothetical protein
MTNITKYVAIAKITDPTAVQAKYAIEGGVAHKGAIYCEIPELGITTPNLIYCRYGLSIPYIRVQADWKLLVEPTVDNERRWFYTGLADCADAVTPTTADQLLIQLVSQVIYANTTTLFLSSQTATEPFVKGNAVKTELDKDKTALQTLQSTLSSWVPAPNDGGLALKTALTAAGFFTLPMADYTNVLSLKIKGE